MIAIEPIGTSAALHLSPHEVEVLIEARHASQAISRPVVRRREQQQWSEQSRHGLLLEGPRQLMESMVLALEGAHRTRGRTRLQFLRAGAWADDPILLRYWQAVWRDLGDAEGLPPRWQRFSHTRPRVSGGETSGRRGTLPEGQWPGEHVPGVCQSVGRHVAGLPPVSAAGMGRR
jgi:hypothetical protein